MRLPRHAVLLVTRDTENNPVCDRTIRSITRGTEPRIGGTVSVTDPESSVRHVGYRQVLDWFLNGNIPSDIEDKLYAVL